MKKYRLLSVILSVLLLVSVFTGCTAAEQLDQAKDTVENRLDAAQDAVGDVLQNTPSTAASTPKLTREEAIAAALTHAGLTQADVTRLHSEYEVDDGIPEWEVDFHSGGWEYDYTIHAETGEILRSEKDLDD